MRWLHVTCLRGPSWRAYLHACCGTSIRTMPSDEADVPTEGDRFGARDDFPGGGRAIRLYHAVPVVMQPPQNRVRYGTGGSVQGAVWPAGEALPHLRMAEAGGRP